VPKIFRSQDLVVIFNRCFLKPFNTRLEGGGEEPLYLPAKSDGNARIIFREDYFSSGLHEISHWCIAGNERRKVEDYGYWYAPDGRSPEQQQLFETAEIKPQALEWIFNRACGYRFNISADNLMAGMGVSEVFKQHILEQAKKYCKNGMSPRAMIFASALADFYGIASFLCADDYDLEQL